MCLSPDTFSCVIIMLWTSSEGGYEKRQYRTAVSCDDLAPHALPGWGDGGAKGG